jgi:hypothetical protein
MRFLLNLKSSRCLSDYYLIVKKQNRSFSSSTSFSTYETEYKRSIEQPESYWNEKKDLIHWYEKPKRILDNANSPFEKW